MTSFSTRSPSTTSVVIAGCLACLVPFVLAGCDEVSDVPGPSEASSNEVREAAPLNDRRMELGLQLLGKGNHAEAQVVFEAVLADHPEHPRPSFLRAVAVQKQGNYAMALEALDGVLDSGAFNGRDSVEHFRGWCLFYLGRPREAEVAFKTHLDAIPASPDSAFGRGVSLLELGRPEEALASLDRALELESNGKQRRRSIGKTWIRRGDALWELGRFEDATRSFHKGVIQFPDHYEGWAKLGRGHARAGDEQKVAWARREERNARSRVGAPIDEETGNQAEVE